jgi:hypothetical protein
MKCPKCNLGDLRNGECNHCGAVFIWLPKEKKAKAHRVKSVTVGKDTNK